MSNQDPYLPMCIQRVKSAHARYIASPRYRELVQEAETRGFRPCTEDEIVESLYVAGDPNTFRWKGGCWKRANQRQLSLGL